MDVQTIINLPRTLKNVGRMREVLAALSRFGFKAVFAQVLPDEWTAWLSGRPVGQHKLRFEERVRALLEELGPTFVKLGQILATRKDLVPANLMEELKRLQDKVESFPTDQARAQIESELGSPISELFQSFEDEPLAAASIGQVHRAVLPDGTQVVVKVQRPGIEEIIRADLEIILYLAELIQPELGSIQLDLVQFVQEFQKSILREIDYRVEAANTQIMARKLVGHKNIRVPRTFNALCTGRVLTLEFFDGVSVREVSKIKEMGFDPAQLASAGTEISLVMALDWGFFHADPHPGNLFVLKDGSLGLIDFGMVGVLDDELTDFLAVFLLAIFTSDPDRLIKVFYRMDLIGHQTDVRALKGDVRALMTSYLGRDMSELDVGQFVGEIFDVIAIYHVQVMPQILLVLKALVTIIGVAEALNPEYNVLEEVKGTVLKIYMRKLSNPQALMRRAYHQVDELVYLARSVPRELHTFLSKLNRNVHVSRHEVSLAATELKARERWVNRALLAVLCGFLTLSGTALAAWLHNNPQASWLYIALVSLQLSLAGGIGALLTLRFVRSGW